MKTIILLGVVTMGICSQTHAQLLTDPHALVVTTWRGDIANPWAPVLDNCGRPFPDGSLVQVIRDGGDGVISAPDVSGNPTGDDALAAASLTPFSINGVSKLGVPGAFAADLAMILFGNVTANGVCFVDSAGHSFYLRAWNNSTPTAATCYAETAMLDARSVGASYLIPDLFTSWTAHSVGPITAPSELTIMADGNDLRLTWSSVMNTCGYTVHSDTVLSNDPGFQTLVGNTTDTTMLVSGSPDDVKFFLVRANY